MKKKALLIVGVVSLVYFISCKKESEFIPDEIKHDTTDKEINIKIHR